jgi:hypothetical protein
MTFDVANLGKTVVIDPDENEVRLGDLWAEGPHVILFLRHFG